MRYANLYWQCTETGQNYRVNIGDNLQFMAIKYLYKKMGIEDQIVELTTKEVKDYDGREYLILPLNWSFFDPAWMNGDMIAISPKIIPVFLAMTLGARHEDKYFNKDNIAYLKKYEPIGCRDEVTRDILRQYGIDAYVNGCLTSILPYSESNERDTVYFADVPIRLKEYIPESMYEKCSFVTHQKYYPKEINIDVIINEVIAQYDEYRRKARLVVTSRLHAASPCMAMGIPVIFVKEIIDERFSWLDKYLVLYDMNKVAKGEQKIEWSPAPIVYEDIKEKILNYSIYRIQRAYEINSTQCEISEWFEDRKKVEYADFRETLFRNFANVNGWIESKWDSNKNITYSIWGITNGANDFCNNISANWPKAKLNNAIDTYKTGEFRGISISKFADIQLEGDEFLFVLAVGAVEEVKKLIEKGCISASRCYFIGDEFLLEKEDSKI